MHSFPPEKILFWQKQSDEVSFRSLFSFLEISFVLRPFPNSLSLGFNLPQVHRAVLGPVGDQKLKGAKRPTSVVTELTKSEDPAGPPRREDPGTISASSEWDSHTKGSEPEKPCCHSGGRKMIMTVLITWTDLAMGSRGERGQFLKPFSFFQVRNPSCLI